MRDCGGGTWAGVAAAVGLSACLSAQSLPAPTILSEPGGGAPALRILKGELVEWNVRGLSGDLLLEEGDDGPRRWRCQITNDTFLSRASIRIHPAGVRPGDTVEIVAEGAPKSCVARTIYVRPPDPRRMRTRVTLARNSILDSLWPRGLLTFTGIVNRVEGDRLYVQTRKFGSKSFALRTDTVYSNGGRKVELADLGTQTRVFIRANRTYEGDLEVYHVIWGEILQTREGH
jgi:hypothetical protein